MERRGEPVVGAAQIVAGRRSPRTTPVRTPRAVPDRRQQLVTAGEKYCCYSVVVNVTAVSRAETGTVCGDEDEDAVTRSVAAEDPAMSDPFLRPMCVAWAL